MVGKSRTESYYHFGKLKLLGVPVDKALSAIEAFCLQPRSLNENFLCMSTLLDKFARLVSRRDSSAKAIEFRGGGVKIPPVSRAVEQSLQAYCYMFCRRSEVHEQTLLDERNYILLAA